MEGMGKLAVASPESRTWKEGEFQVSRQAALTGVLNTVMGNHEEIQAGGSLKGSLMADNSFSPWLWFLGLEGIMSCPQFLAQGFGNPGNFLSDGSVICYS